MNKIFYKCDIVVFGGHGDLSFRKLIPALYHLVKDAHIDLNSRIIIASRTKMSNSDNTKLIKEKLKTFLNKDEEFEDEVFAKFESLIKYCHIDFAENKTFKNLENLLTKNQNEERIFYFSTASEFYENICKSLSDYKLISTTSRVVLEKPIGKNLETSKVINEKVLEYFKEDQIYRIDHYLGKDTVQNLIALRFSNKMFVPLWDANNIDHIQITLSESVGVESRWEFYNQYGAMRDMVQNHLMQLVCLLAMEPPHSLDPNAIRDEKLKVLNSLRSIEEKDMKNHAIRAQYTAGIVDGKEVKGYLDDGNSQSDTETFVALKLFIDNFRWSDTPFYIRTGKRMPSKNSEIVIQFKSIPYSIFDNYTMPNKLIISFSPDESITLNLMHKIPGLDEKMKLQEVSLELNPPRSFVRKNEAYERLLLDVIRANPTLFMRLDEVNAAWKWTDKIISAWQNNITPMQTYKAGTNGPASAISMLAKDERVWHEN
ncbi:glucose-6-phosphate dehydrogenase [Poseidonibacter ostreae]|jgi:glucose-6-phosphate 1-dehydrogenase|uniref:Glucose-6-phosphate 1-dehydrogenase n=1 Tax=Poseidonibacter ostreae TaxID=2654171 RepID=A0A6L4WS59_9BACT|nr:glucose-6-phosphate dehydrogenase [Poseidonibacter ostreae]KAB7885622.1 glucose-6-phosphate dehydrogenase [Poseidonibacter ostreae]KAB7888273.1 glucose-6-phosphate dehydrogenase [Poseidonibacter ostreae]KAB7889157.1 glucose-6-phosphate dehydrogenase [Poseidonibacter ostreae]